MAVNLQVQSPLLRAIHDRLLLKLAELPVTLLLRKSYETFRNPSPS